MPTPSSHTAHAPAHLRRPRVLIVEDEPRLRDLLLEVLPDMGFTPLAVRSAEEAIRLTETDPPEIMMLDLRLPGMDGMEFFERTHQRRPEVPVIIMTGFGDLDSARRAIQLDVVDFLTKPFHLNEVEVALDRARKRMMAGIPGGDPQDSPGEKPVETTLADAERRMIVAALHRHSGNRTAAALELGISRRKLHYWLNENGY